MKPMRNMHPLLCGLNRASYSLILGSPGTADALAPGQAPVREAAWSQLPTPPQAPRSGVSWGLEDPQF